MPSENYYVFPPFPLILPLFKHFVKLQPTPMWWPLLYSQASSFKLIGHAGEKHCIRIPSKSGFICDKIGLSWDLVAFRFHFKI
ncbi:hypothetical protein KUTeg_004118 [Tegillarca granosa]|uniref:Uncharacterized protein n=1 Tax=Tegillarca granosa TaxID=220873 RepID=A0ABQ9FP20_TEGGR|nr:hypothetical protein KUTeg_004118 [Tegillarca granosa]